MIAVAAASIALLLILFLSSLRTQIFDGVSFDFRSFYPHQHVSRNRPLERLGPLSYLLNPVHPIVHPIEEHSIPIDSRWKGGETGVAEQ